MKAEKNIAEQDAKWDKYFADFDESFKKSRGQDMADFKELLESNHRQLVRWMIGLHIGNILATCAFLAVYWWFVIK